MVWHTAFLLYYTSYSGSWVRTSDRTPSLSEFKYEFCFKKFLRFPVNESIAKKPAYTKNSLMIFVIQAAQNPRGKYLPSHYERVGLYPAVERI